MRRGRDGRGFGVGGVGLATLQSARIAGASTIIAVDVSPEKEELARAAGATEFVVASGTHGQGHPRGSPAARAWTSPSSAWAARVTIRTAWESTRRGGRTTVVGIGGKDQQVTFNALELFHWGRTLSGCVYGNSDPAKDLPVLADHIRAGRLDLGALVTERIGLDGHPGGLREHAGGQGRTGAGGLLTAGGQARVPGRRAAGQAECGVRSGPGSGAVPRSSTGEPPRSRCRRRGPRGRGLCGRGLRGRVRRRCPRPDRDTATPARHSAPPASVSSPGTSPSASHDIRTTSAGTAYVVAPIRLAVVRASAYAQVVKASAVGKTPR